MKSQTFYQKFNHLFPSEPGTIHTHHCKEGVRNDSFYITRNQDMSVVAFCHHCQESGYWQDTLEKVLSKRNPKTKKKNSFDIPEPKNFKTCARWEEIAFSELSKDFRYWWLSSGLNVSDINTFGIKHLDGNLCGIPIYANTNMQTQLEPTGVLVRPLKDNLPKWIEVGEKVQVPFTVSYGPTNVIVLCEDIISAFRLSKHCYAMPIFGTAFSDQHLAALLKFDMPVIVWLDNDNEVVKRKARQIYRRLAQLRDTSLITEQLEAKHISSEEDLLCWIHRYYTPSERERSIKDSPPS